MCTTRSHSRPAPAIEPATLASRARRGWRDAALVLVGHGSSRCPGATATLERHAKAIAEGGLFAEVRVAVLQGGAPPAEALRRLAGSEVYLTRCADFFPRKEFMVALRTR